jgi:hypothetical protein
MTINVSEVTVGDQVRYRVTKGRGRPAVGEVLAKNGLFIKIKNLGSGEIQNVNRDRLTAPYEFKPYAMSDKQRKAWTPSGNPRKPWTRRNVVVEASQEAVAV